MKRAVFLDRDGVINVDKNYVFKQSDFEFVENIFSELKYLQELDFLLFIITNQSGISRGYYTKTDFDILTDWMLKKFAEQKINISQVEYCPHRPEEKCKCRKPEIGMIENILENYDVDLSNSWLIGDRLSDIECAKSIGIMNTIRIDNNISNIINISKSQYECKNISFIRKIIVK